MIVIWGFIVTLATMVPSKVGPYSTLAQCYAQLPTYIGSIEKVDTANQYRGACLPFDRHGKSSEPAPDTQWLTSAQLAAKAN